VRSAAGIVGPAFLALTIAITIHPLLAWLQRRRVPGWLAVALTMLVTYAALLAMAAALVLAAAQLATLLPGYQSQFTSLVDQVTGWLGELGVTQQQLNTAVSKFDLNSLARVLQQVLTGVAGVASDLGLLLEPVLFAAVGAAAGAAGARLSALGLNQWFLGQLDETLEPGRAALFVAVSDADPEQATQALASLAPKVLRTTLLADAERRLLAAFIDTAPQAGSASPSPPASD
jgi:uncharacterized membrane protein